MYLEQANFDKETVREVQKYQKGVDYPIINGGYPTFNTCNHTTLDMSYLNDAFKERDAFHTLSIKLDENRYVTFCVMKLSEEQFCIDTKFHSDKHSTRLMEFNKGSERKLDDVNLVALINDKK